MAVRMNNFCCNISVARFFWVVLLSVVISFDGNAGMLGSNVNTDFSTILAQETNDSPEFLRKSKIEIDSYFSRVIDYNDAQVVFKRSKSRILTDLTDIVNYYLNVYCSDLEIQFGGFSPVINDQVLNLESSTSTNFSTTALEDLETRLAILKNDLNVELSEFILIFEQEDESSTNNVIKYLPLYPIDTPELYLLEEKDVSALDPNTGSPLLKDDQLGQRIVQLLESNNKLIEILSTQLITLNQEMLILKKEGLEYQREFSDIHQRIDGLENAINDIRSSNINISTNTNLQPIGNQKISTVFFDKNSIEITSEFIPVLNEIYGELMSNKKLRVIVTGFADKSGNVYLNNRISKLRAQVVTQYLVGKGVSKNQLLENYLGDTQSTKETKSDRKVEIEWLSE